MKMSRRTVLALTIVVRRLRMRGGWRRMRSLRLRILWLGPRLLLRLRVLRLRLRPFLRLRVLRLGLRPFLGLRVLRLGLWPRLRLRVLRLGLRSLLRLREFRSEARRLLWSLCLRSASRSLRTLHRSRVSIRGLVAEIARMRFGRGAVSGRLCRAGGARDRCTTRPDDVRGSEGGRARSGRDRRAALIELR